MDSPQVTVPQEERSEAIAEAQPRPIGRGSLLLESLRRREVTLVAVILVLSTMLAFLRPKSFLTKLNILTTANGFALNAIVTIGMTIALIGVAYPQAGKRLELEAIASSIIGGCSLSGGEGTIYGALLGIALIALIRDGTVLMDVIIARTRYIFAQCIANGSKRAYHRLAIHEAGMW